MIKFIIGPKGSGKTRTVVEMANKALEDCKGEIVFVNGDNRHMVGLNYRIRYVSAKEFGIKKLNVFYGFLSGLIARNYDTDQIFIDGLLDVSAEDPDEIKRFLYDIKKLADKFNTKFVITLNGNPESVPAFLQEYIA
ncbi:MAG TPA: ATP-binding protein [Clostridiales bacterium]|nr:ATP-binding protein [Clostridiales bacterium]